MNQAMVDNIARAVLYEGYILYPYRRGTKNHHRWTFGGLFPRDYALATRGAEPCEARTQCLIRGDRDTRLTIRARFLHLIQRQVLTLCGDPVDALDVAGKRYQTWQEAQERDATLEMTLGQSSSAPFSFPASCEEESLHDADGRLAATLIRHRAAIYGTIEATAEPLRDDVYCLTVSIQNLSDLPVAPESSRNRAQLHSLASAHLLLSAATAGQFVSMIDPPDDLKDLARQCRGCGLWPVLVGEAGSADALLAAPIILYDYPQIAPESPGDLFDGTEIDEILSLRVMTLTDDEKRDAAALDARGAAMLRRTESLARDQLLRLHGTMRPPHKVEAVHVGRAELRAGDRVRLRPRGNADAFDLLLRGRSATIAAIEQDYENRIHLAVTIDDDPGADLGADGKVGHRFYFGPDEVEPLIATSAEVPSR
jgi:hypothetical protein